MTKKKILISGAGISGFLTYLYLDRSKYEVTLIERGECFRSVGYAIVMWNCGFEILRNTLFKNDPSYAERFVRLDKSLLVNEHTFPQSLYSLRHLGCVVDREDLLGMFVAEAKKLEGRMLTETWIESISPHEGKSAVTFNKGTVEEFDLVVVCEGINSSTRDRFFTGIRVVDSDYAVEYVETKRIDVLSAKNIIFSTDRFTGVIMTTPRSTVLAHFLLKKQGDYLHTREGLRSFLNQGLVAEYGPSATPEYPAETQTFDLKDVYAESFYTNNMVLLGDAAHGRVPVLGLGTTLATEDAFALSSVLNALDSDRWREQIDTALHTFSTERHKRSEQLYAIQELVTRSSLPLEHPRCGREHGQAYKIVLNVLGRVQNRAFTALFRRAVG